MYACMYVYMYVHYTQREREREGTVKLVYACLSVCLDMRMYVCKRACMYASVYVFCLQLLLGIDQGLANKLRIRHRGETYKRKPLTTAPTIINHA